MINIVLVEPEIPNNTGAIGRTCVCTGARLHLIRPLGFDISDKAVRRAGMDYWYDIDLHVYDSIDEYFEKNGDENIWLTTTKAPKSYVDCDFTTENVAPGEIPGPVHPHPHASQRAEPEPVQRRCHHDL